VGKHYNNPQCFKEKNYEAQFSTSSIYIKKIDKDYFGKKKRRKKFIKKINHVGKHRSIP
jgi:hypothetical protein